MGCRCNERRAALIDAAGAARQRDGRRLIDRLAFVGRTARQDAAAALGLPPRLPGVTVRDLRRR